MGQSFVRVLSPYCLNEWSRFLAPVLDLVQTKDMAEQNRIVLPLISMMKVRKKSRKIRHRHSVSFGEKKESAKRENVLF